MKRISLFLSFFLGLPKTLFFNFKLLPFKDAIFLPVWVSRNVFLKNTTGKLFLGAVKPGIVRIGFGDVGVFDKKVSRTIWDVSGEARFVGSAHIGHGSKLSVSGMIEFGENFVVTAESVFIAANQICFGQNVLVSWQVTFMDTDFHSIFDNNDKRINEDDEIVIGDEVWIGFGATLLKGSGLADGSVVASRSLISKKYTEPFCLLGGVPATVLRKGIRWEM